MFVETKEAGEVAEAPTKTLKLSEAMRIGARMTSQCRHALFDGPSGSCAIGSVALGRGYKYSEAWSATAVVAAFVPEVAGGRMGKSGHLFHEIGSRNDDGWTREQIADWLETQGR